LFWLAAPLAGVLFLFFIFFYFNVYPGVLPSRLKGQLALLFLKALKSLALAHAVNPVGGCAVGIGLIFNAFIRGIAYSPELEDSLFSQAMLGFALIESFLIIAIATLGLIYAG